MIKAIIFDCFGVIYSDTLAIVERKYIKQNSEDMVAIKDLRRQNDLGMLTRDEFWNQAAAILGISRAELDKQISGATGADWELLEYIKQLKSNYKTAILSNVGQGFLERIFDNNHPQGSYFDALIASGDHGITKPDKEIYLIAADRLGVDARDCVFIDDLEKHTVGAREVGMQTIIYKDFEGMKQQLEQMLKS
jgi:HAD superfamily hydrolase (TIGR01549 family)